MPLRAGLLRNRRPRQNRQKQTGGTYGKVFGLKKHGTTVRTEILAGLTTFMAMAYILMVNANMFANPFSDGTNVLGVSYGAIYIATAISAVIGSVLIGLLSNLPLAQASGMGLNAFFVYTVCVGFGFTYANALVFVLVDGLIFILLTITGLRKRSSPPSPTPSARPSPQALACLSRSSACRMSASSRRMPAPALPSAPSTCSTMPMSAGRPSCP